MNELRVVRKIEESIKAAKGPRLQIIKSRELKNAKSFADKIYRVLKLHGYKLQALDRENFNQKVEKSNTDSLKIYTIDEPTIKDIMGNGLNETEKPIRALFDNSMLSYLKAPVLIVVVSDQFYGSTGLQSYAQSLSSNNSNGNYANNRNKVAKPLSNRSTVASLYLAAVAFFASGLNSTFGNYLAISPNPYNTFYILPSIILLVSIAAIVGRAISIRNESRNSVPLVVASIALFIVLTVLGAFSGYLPGVLNGAVNEFQGTVIYYYKPSLAVFILIGVIYSMAMLRYVFYLGRGSGRAAYAMTGFGVLWMTFFIVVNMIDTYSTTVFPTVLGTSGVSQIFPSISFDLPLFGFNYAFNSNVIPQYMVTINDLVLIGNFIMAIGLLLAAKSQRENWVVPSNTEVKSSKASA